MSATKPLYPVFICGCVVTVSDSGVVSWQSGGGTALITWCEPISVYRADHHSAGRAETERDGTRKRTGGELKEKKANGGGSQQSCTVSDTVYPELLPLMRTPRLSVVD